jgi:drug/metabolite transporter (DMT)-like permease
MDHAAARPARHDGGKGIACLVAGVALFSIQDLILKALSGEYPLHQAMVLRSVTAMPLLLAFVAFDGGLRTLHTRGWPILLARGAILFAAYASYYLGLAALPLASAVALFFAAPLFITAMSVIVLDEQVGPRRWVAVLAGFGGVVVIVRPGSALFDWAALLPVAAGFAYGLSMIYARRIGVRETAAVMAFYGNGVLMAGAVLLALAFGTGAFAAGEHRSMGFLMRGWAAPSFVDLGLMLACGVVAAAGLTLLTQAYRIAEANVVAPFEYTALLWAVIYGWAFWRDLPDATAWVGIAVIVGSGLYVLHREGAARREGS